MLCLSRCHHQTDNITWYWPAKKLTSCCDELRSQTLLKQEAVIPAHQWDMHSLLEYCIWKGYYLKGCGDQSKPATIFTSLQLKLQFSACPLMANVSLDCVPLLAITLKAYIPLVRLHHYYYTDNESL